MSTAIATLFATCAPLIHPTTLSALIRVESAANPYAVSLNRPAELEGRGLDQTTLIPRQPRSAPEALALTRTLLKRGLTTSVGLAQINIEHLLYLHLRLADLFDPCINLKVAQRILIDCAAAQPAAAGYRPSTPPQVRRTLSCYNTGNVYAGLTNGYVDRIRRSALRAATPTLLAHR
jgi:type IV secretion system protein VirB1